MKRTRYANRLSGLSPSQLRKEIDLNDSIMTLNDAAPFIGKSVSAVRKMCQRNQIPAHRLNYRWMFLKSEILIWLKEQ